MTVITLAKLRAIGSVDKITIHASGADTLLIDIQTEGRDFQLTDSSGTPLRLQSMSQVRSCLHGIASPETQFEYNREDETPINGISEMMTPTSLLRMAQRH